MLQCDNVTKKYGSFIAVNDVSIQLLPGNIYALLGPNGSGKSTLMKIIMGLIKPTSGTVTIEDHLLTNADKAYITYMPTENYFYGYMKIKDIANYYKEFFPDFSEEHFKELLYKMELNHTDKVSRMSTGMMAKLKVAVAMARDSKVIMLDEPLNGIDLIAREYVVRAIREYSYGDKIVIVSSHIVEDLERIVTGALFMRNGQMVLAGDANKMREANGKNLIEIYKDIYGFGGGTYASPY